MDTNSVKQSVVAGYGKLAKSASSGFFSKLFACCDANQHAAKVGEKIGYSKETLASIPENSNLGVSCGNPSALAQINEGETVVDLGSGAGFDAFIVAPLVTKTGKVIGVDLSDDMLDLARRNAQKGNYEHVEFVKGDIEDLPLADEIADHIVSNCVINLSLHKDKVYKEAFRVLKKGGKLSVSDIILEQELPDVVKHSLAGYMACISGAEKIEDYLKYIRDAGFTDINIASKSSFPLELMLADPQIAKIAEQMNVALDSQEAKEMASRVVSVSITATK
ncbi:MAG: arsenite methyltransferase [Bacteroidota bacterium]